MSPAPGDAADWATVLATADCLADEAAVQAAIRRIARQVSDDLADRRPLVLCVARGGIVFAGQLLPQLHFPLEFDYVHATRYGDARHGGELEWRVPPPAAVAGRHVLVVDDILDAGTTLAAIRQSCLARGALTVRIAVLVEKLHARKAEPGVVADYCGLQLPDRFLFGFGMDVRGYWRNAPGIYAVRT